MIRQLESRAWATEELPRSARWLRGSHVLTTGDLDALLRGRTPYLGFEWEAGNVSSTHRAINKLLDGITRGTLSGGILVLAVRATQPYLTDRVGNFEEIAPYFELWSRYPVPDGALRVYGVGHDARAVDLAQIERRIGEDRVDRLVIDAAEEIDAVFVEERPAKLSVRSAGRGRGRFQDTNTSSIIGRIARGDHDFEFGASLMMLAVAIVDAGCFPRTAT